LDKREMLKMRDKDIRKILADNYPLMKRFENYFALSEAVQVTRNIGGAR
jgi:hypothetical protein